MQDTLLTKKEAADRLRISTRTIDRLRATEALGWVPVGGQVRFRQADLDSYVAKQAQGGGKGMGA